jgi:hypothetical protein
MWLKAFSLILLNGQQFNIGSTNIFKQVVAALYIAEGRCRMSS